jgi:zinc protease
MKTAKGIALLLCLAALALVVRAQDKKVETVRPPKVDIHSHTLANGLKVLTVEDHSVPVINLQVWYHVGSKDEKSGRTGFAHLFEHLMFKGSAHVGADEMSRIIESVGGFDNAYTNDDCTVYWETFPSNYLERMIWLEADRMGSLNVSEENFTSEREVVKEERRLRVDNRPYGLVQEDLYAAAFTVHGYHHTTIGSLDDLNKAKIEDVRDFFHTFYRPNNATMVIVGDFSEAEALRWAKKYFAGIPASPAPIPRLTAQEPPQTEERIVNKSYSNTPLAAVVEGFKVPPSFSPDSYALNLASNILAQGESSRLYQTLVYKDRIAVFSAGFGFFTEDPNLFWAFAVMNQGHTAEEGEKAVDAVLEQMKTQPMDAKELEKAKNQIISSFILGRQTDQTKGDAIGDAAVIGKDPNLVNTQLGHFLNVTPADIQRVSKEYFSKQRETVLLISAPAAKGKEGSGK